tara:strand:+ start:828 stop:3164 length:2337 start_codon:yes stop_codon:yes gene_type:complete
MDEIEKIELAIRNADAAGRTSDVQALAAERSRLMSSQQLKPTPQQEQFDPFNGMSDQARTMFKFGGHIKDAASNIPETISDAFTGNSKETEETRTLPELGEFGGKSFEGLSGGQQTQIMAGLMVTFDEDAQKDIIRSAVPEATFRVDDKGNTFVKFGENMPESVLNEPGMSGQDAKRLLTTALSFIPAGRVATMATSLAGRMGIAAAANAGTDLAMQGTSKLLGSDQNINLPQTALAAGGGMLGEYIFPASKAVAPIRNQSGGYVDNSGNSTELLEQVMNTTGQTSDNFNAPSMQQIAEGLDPSQIARQQRFAEIGVPTTKGIVTQNPVQMGREATLLGRTDDIGQLISAPLRQRMDDVQLGFQGSLNTLVKKLGVPDDVGSSIQNAVKGKKRLLGAERTNFYNLAKKADGELANMPVLTQNMFDALPDARTFREFAALDPANTKAFRDLLVEFGIDRTPARMQAFLKQDEAIIEPLNVGNFELFRKGMNRVMNNDMTGSMSALINPFKKAFDNELDVVFKSLDNTNINPQSLTLFKQARAAHANIKTEFDPKRLAGELLAPKARGSNVPKIDESQVFASITKPTTTIEQVDNLVTTLSTAGDAGAKALNDLQANTVLSALEKSLSNVSSKGAAGQRAFAPVQFIKELERLGPKLEIIFKNNPSALRTLRMIEQSANDIVVSGQTMPKGSAPMVGAVLDMLSAFKSLPLIRHGIASVQTGSALRSSAQKSKRAVSKTTLMNESFQRAYPEIASLLGKTAIASTSGQEQELNQKLKEQL